MRTLEDITAELELSMPDLSTEERADMAQSIYDEELRVYNIQQEILAARDSMSPELKAAVEEWDASTPVIRQSGRTLTLWEREEKLIAWAEDTVARKAAAATNAINEIKAFTAQLIINHFPEWRQRNMIAWSANLTDLIVGGHTPTPEELAQKAQIQAVWGWVQTVRAFSGTLETRVQNGEVIDDLSAEPWPSLT